MKKETKRSLFTNIEWLMSIYQYTQRDSRVSIYVIWVGLIYLPTSFRLSSVISCTKL